MTVDDLAGELAVLRGVVPAERAREWERALGLDAESLSIALLGWASSFADPHISGFRVGAVAHAASGALYAGGNLEFSGAPLSFAVHAEQAAVANASLNGEREILSIATSAVPCGYCRQFLNELANADRLRVLVPKGHPMTLPELLPKAFGPAELRVAGDLLRAPAHGLVLADAARTGRLVEAALDAANRSYAPYSKTYAGVALATGAGTIHVGRYAENVAFNPSLSPLQAALVSLRLAGDAPARLAEVVLVEADGPAEHGETTAALLAAVSPVSLTVLRAIPA